MNADENFYEQLPVLDHFLNASNTTCYEPLPDDWFIAITDIQNSTEAIENDQYKSVNIIGASAIAGILNIVNQDTVPFLFGGDGATIAIPPDLHETTEKVLASCRKIAADAYDLKLRASLIPVSHIYEQQKQIKVAKFRVSEHYTQALFTGNGIGYIEKMLKDTQANKPFAVEKIDNGSALTSFSGLECRWKEVSIPNKEVITLLVNKAPGATGDDSVYSQTLQKLRNIFGFDNVTNPIASDELGMNLKWSELMVETKLRTFGKSNWERIKHLLITQLKILFGKIFMRFGYQSSQTDWSRYKTDMVINSDHRKFDDTLRIVISGSTEQRQKMEQFLESQFQKGTLAYGMHITNAAVITCMVFRYQHEHIHFVDGSNGGYVMAARQLKERMERLNSN